MTPNRWPPRSLLGFALLLAIDGAHAGEDDDLADLLDLLADETELATRSKQNADYVPGIISVLHADEARLLGARSVLDALAQIPGMEVQRDQFGAATIRVRSIDFFFNGGNVKVLVDSLPISRETAFQNSAILLMPIEQVERIEVIRGPGSGVHGDFAFMGLVNIVTRHRGNAVAAGVGSGDRRNLTGRFDSGDDAPLRIDGNLSTWHSDRHDGPHALPHDESRQYLNLALRAGAFSLSAAAIERDFDGLMRAFGGPGRPPPPPGATLPVDQEERNHVVQARYQWLGDDEARSAVWLQYNRSRFDRDRAGFDGDRLELGGEAVRRFGAHLMLAQLQVASLGIDEAFVPPGRPFPTVDETRDYLALTVQDQWDLNDHLQLTGGLRYDDLEDIDSAVTPRIAGLWRISDRHLLKAQYAEGFRSPTYIELYDGGPPPDSTPFERVSTRELAYVFRMPRTVLRATAFEARVSDMIFPRNTPAFNDDRTIRSRGWEFELTHQWSPRWKSIASWSTANAFDDRTAVIVPGQPPTFGGPSLSQPEELGNLALLARFNAQWSAGLHWNHVGRRADRGQEGFQPGYESVNLGIEYTPAAVPQLRLALAARNLLDERIFHLATQPPNTVLQLDYAARLWGVTAEWTF